MGKSILPCPGCGAPVELRLLKRHYKATSLSTPRPILCCYFYSCKCGENSTYDKEAVNQFWEENNKIIKRKI